MNKRYIRLDECDVSSESALGNQLPQAMNHKFPEHLRESLAMQHPTSSAMRVGSLISEHLQECSNRIYSEFPEQSWNSLKEPVQERGEHPQPNKEHQGGVHSEFREASQHSLGTLNVCRSRVQAANHVDPQQVPLMGYEQYPQEMQAYPVAREPVNVQPVVTSNSSALLDLPNVQTDLPTPLIPQQVNQPVIEGRGGMTENTQQSRPNVDTVTSNQILESIQNITRVMQQQLVFNGKTTEAGILQTASLFQEMIKAQEKRDLDPALMAIPTFSGQATDRPQCLDWVSRVKNVCDQSGRSFRQELINKSGILVQNFIKSLGEQITNKELTEKNLQFFSDIPTTSHVLNKLRLIQQEADEPIVNYNQQYQNLVERVEGCQLNNITSMDAMELYLGSIIEPIWKSIRNALYFNSKHAPKTLGEAMQKAQDLHIKHLYVLGEDQQDSSTTSSSDALLETIVSEVNARENKGWYKSNCEYSEHSKNSREVPRQMGNYT